MLSVSLIRGSIYLKKVGPEFCQTQIQAQQISPSRTRSFPRTTTRGRKRTLTKIYQNEVYYRLGIWNIDLTIKIKTSLTIPGMVTNHPEDSHPTNSTRSLTLAQPSLSKTYFMSRSIQRQLQGSPQGYLNLLSLALLN